MGYHQRHAPFGAFPSASRTIAACRDDTEPPFHRQAGMVSSPTATRLGSVTIGSGLGRCSAGSAGSRTGTVEAG